MFLITRRRHTAVRAGKHRPETCCIIGNYYSLKAQHERAVLYFRRALRLNRRYLSAWTLMGHECVFVDRTPAGRTNDGAAERTPRRFARWGECTHGDNTVPPARKRW